MPLAWPALLAFLAAAPGPVAVVDVDAPDLMIGLGAQITRSIVQSAEAQKLAVLRPDQLRVKLDPAKYEALRKCHADVVCVTDIVSELGVARVVTGKLGRDEKNYLLQLWLIDVPSRTVVADVDRAILIAARRLQKDVDQAIPPLLRGEREARGKLTLKSNLADAQISINGEFAGVPPLTVSLKPGKYEVKVERNKYLSVTRLIAVEANQETDETIKLLLKPGEVPDAEVVPPLAKKGEGADGPTVRLSAWTWLSGGVAIAATGVGLYFGLTMRAQEKALLDGYDPNTNVYQGTRRDALVAQQNALIANVSFGIAGTAALATVIFTILDLRAPADVQVTPVATAQGGGVLVGGRF